MFLAFAPPQTGMIVRGRRRREDGWQRALSINAFGAVLSASVLVVMPLLLRETVAHTQEHLRGEAVAAKKEELARKVAECASRSGWRRACS